MTTRRGHAFAALLLALFVLLLFARLLFTDRVLASGDILHYFYPYRDYAAAALRAGEIPLWNPYIFGGVPFLANPQAAVLYPLHWPLSWLPVTKQIYWSGAIHAWILALGGYALMRRLGSGWLGAVVTGLVLAGSGFYGGLFGHINQMNAGAWLPWMVWAVVSRQSSAARHQSPVTDSVLRIAYFSLFVALSLLAGHTQTVYINLFGVGIVGAGEWIVGIKRWQRRESPRPTPHSLLVFPLTFILGTALGLLLSAGQLLPTLELSGLGLRGGGLTYQEVTSFSLRPLLLGWTLLPSYGLWDLSVVFGTLGYTEFVASVGTLALLLAGGALWRERGSRLWWVGVGFACLGLALALGRWNPLYFLLYKIVPGFDLFRTPARWMMLYSLGIAILAGAGIGEWGSGIRDWGGGNQSAVKDRRSVVFGWRSAVGILLLCVLAADLLLAARSLPHAHPTAPQAVYDIRTAPAHLLTDPQRGLHPGAMGRFLSMSTLTFDPGDMADWRRIYRQGDPPQLDEAAFQEFVVALKSQEILAPNLSLLQRVPAVDGFDGGVLPLERYNRFLALFIPPEELVPDGRLREQVKRIPAGALLELMDIRYVITDKVEDLWFDGVYYDRQIGARLGWDGVDEVIVPVDQPFQATEIRIIGSLVQGADALQSTPQVVELTASGGGQRFLFPPIAGGRGGALPQFGPNRMGEVRTDRGISGVAYQDTAGGRQEYLIRLGLPGLRNLESLRFSLTPETPPSVAVQIQAVTLYDGTTGTFLPLLPSDRGHFRLVHSGDVKIYERVGGPGRVSLLTDVTAVGNPDAALAALLAAPGRGAVIEAEPAAVAAWGLAGGEAGRAVLQSYTAERVVVETESDKPALLLLRDAFYPGWRATIDGVPTEIYPANLLLRGVAVPAGQHQIVFVYDPPVWRRGLALSVGGSGLWLLLVGWLWLGRRRAVV